MQYGVFHHDAVLVEVVYNHFGHVQFDDLLSFDVLEVVLAVLEQVFDQFVFQFFDAAARFDLRYGGRLVFRAPADDFLVADKLFKVDYL